MERRPTAEQRKHDAEQRELALRIAQRGIEEYTHGNMSAAQAHFEDLNVVMPHVDPYELVRSALKAKRT